VNTFYKGTWLAKNSKAYELYKLHIQAKDAEDKQFYKKQLDTHLKKLDKQQAALERDDTKEYAQLMYT